MTITSPGLYILVLEIHLCFIPIETTPTVGDKSLAPCTYNSVSFPFLVLLPIFTFISMTPHLTLLPC